MDFHSLKRRELQELCKKNKIPANMTNVAMADALKALEIVEGIEDYLKPMESETAQSSIESPVKSEETSPCALSTVGRSTRRRNVVKEESETLPSRTTTRRSTRKTVVGEEGEKGVAIETPALAATTRRRAQVSMVRRKVEAQFDEEEIGKERKTLPPTPAPLGTTSRRKVKEEESTVKKVYSTRRSVRLAEKSVEIQKSNNEEKLETLKQELFAKEMGDNLDVNLTQGSDGIDTKTMTQDNSDRETISEVEDPKFSMEGGSKNMENQLDLVNEIQENDGSHNTCISKAENALDYGVKSKSEADDTVDDGLEDKDDEISCDTRSQNSTEKETENAEDMDFQVSPDVLVDEKCCDVDSKKESDKELKDEKYMETPAAYIVGEGNGIDLVKDVEMGLAPSDSEADFELTDDSTFPKQMIDNGKELNSTEILQHEQSEQDAGQVSIASEESLGEISSDEGSAIDLVKDVEMGLAPNDSEADFELTDDSTFPKQMIDNGEELNSTEILQREQSEQDADQVSIASEESLGEISSDEVEANLDVIHDSTFPKQMGERLESIEILEFEQSKQASDQEAIEGATDVPLSLLTLIPTADPTEEVQSTSLTPMKTPIKKTPKTMEKVPDVLDNKENIGSGSKFFIFTEKKVKTPSKTPPTNKKMTDATDNKENLDSGKKMILLGKEKLQKTKGTTAEQNLHELSLRKLTKMFKEKLQITNQLSKNEDDPKQAATATLRPALQALPENQLVDEAQN
ncbi:Hypothetical predicted protein [Olea europaea subsp. europaea]|uniref:Uncharacterized protein n=1 Tax=Olea europaea subsp. europaea TaxID=158383 RepID=A0A8S0PW57_OLEEU|nr:Hypothetical predicted protein [Olea europaea subsp. europaea]